MLKSILSIRKITFLLWLSLPHLDVLESWTKCPQVTLGGEGPSEPLGHRGRQTSARPCAHIAARFEI